MDGTLVDTEPYWMACEHELVAAFGGRWTEEDARSIIGFDLLDAAVVLRERGGVDLEPRDIVERMLDGVVARVREKVPWRPGARLSVIARTRVIEMRVVQRVDGVAKGPDDDQRRGDQHLVGKRQSIRRGQLGGDRRQDDKRQQEAQRQQQPAVGIILDRGAAQLGGAEAEQRGAGGQIDQSGEVEPGEKAAFGAEQGNAAAPSRRQQPEEQHEAHRCDAIADTLALCHGCAN